MTRREVNGLLLLDKPTGLSSNHALQRAKRFFNAKKAGHTGSLDPLASGLLPICFGEATKFAQYYLDADKAYAVEAQLGVRTTTSDAEGEVVDERAIPSLTIDQIEQFANHFRGEIEQTPSIYSALKYQGQPLYSYARRGIDVPRPTRTIHIYQLDVLSLEEDRLRLFVRCSKGTYIRTLVDDLGELIGCGAHVTVLRRTGVGQFSVANTVTLDQLQQWSEASHIDQMDGTLVSLEQMMTGWPSLALSDEAVQYMFQGKTIQTTAPVEPGLVALYSPDSRLIGIGECDEQGMCCAKRLVKAPS